MTLELAIVGGTVYDGSGGPARAADIGVAGGRIVQLRQRDAAAAAPPLEARRTIDATGRAVFPGFIDIHSHSDIAWLVWPNATSKLLSGVTTDVSGNCGYGGFPLAGETLARRQAEWDRFGVRFDWTDAAGYFARLEATACGVNRAVLVGHNNLRGVAVGYDNVQPTRPQMDRMCELLGEGLAAGAFGLSSGLIYQPGCWARLDELAELAGVVARFRGLYSSHIRNEAGRLLESVDEFIATVAPSGCRGLISHLKTAGQENWHKIDALHDRLSAARAAGVDVWADRYPYTATCTSLSAMVLPAWAVEGQTQQIIDRLASPEGRRRIVDHSDAAHDDAFFESILVTSFANARLAPLAGQSLGKIARDRGQRPIEAAIDLLREDRLEAEAIHFCMSEDNLARILSWPFVMIGSDYSARDALAPGEMCHPRAFGTPAAFLGRFVRERKVCDLPTAARKLAALPAEMLGLRDRGGVALGYWADLTIFDPDAVVDRATYAAPRTPPGGIDHVLVNGQLAVESGRFTGALAGAVLRRQ